MAVLAAEAAAQLQRLLWESRGVRGKGRKLTDVHGEVPGRPYLLYLLSGFLPHEQGEGDGSGEGRIARERFEPRNCTWNKCNLQFFICFFFLDGDGEETDSCVGCSFRNSIC